MTKIVNHDSWFWKHEMIFMLASFIDSLLKTIMIWLERFLTYCLLLGWDNASSTFDCRGGLEVENCHERWSEGKYKANNVKKYQIPP